MIPYYSDDHVTLYHGDCLDVLAAMPDASVDSVVTDPPVPTRHEAPDVAELRRLAENATPGPWGHDDDGEVWDGSYLSLICHPPMVADAAFIAAANPVAVLGLLDRLAHMTEARDNARAEVERLSAQVEAVRALHASSGDEESQGYLPGGGYGYISPYCTGCEASDEYAVAWPCATIRALEGAES